ncbi:hypothetical protein EDB81DRAFT_89812 [Dactylonectria macrodidyma]|uniref:Zn(2)-C6 fungal-type domain-containing protein n=1 Tax=Dactylonectria macrodidyma TaxID=307937 RepID=A0A9P9ECI9_9HYPO|nr:hypothetical protein EDB81DRAFT_89812 [Dactylonectria macrodidyma]
MSLARRNNGCYECCKRRLKCDKTEPECLKCLKKGISCSGQGLRCRFSGHMTPAGSQPARKSRAALSIASPTQIVETVASPSSASTVSTATRAGYRWIDAGDKLRRPRSANLRRRSLTNSASPASETFSDTISNEDVEESGDMVLYRNYAPLQPALDDSLHPQARALFSHFAEGVAPIMVVFDSISNGYRDIILPLARQDEVLSRAVSVVAAFHLAEKAPELRSVAEAGHQAIVQKLRRDSIQQPGQVFGPFTLATILVLLVGETITGADNYGYLLEMLACLTKCPETVMALPLELRQFFWQQIKMFQLFGLPLANETKGLQILTGSPDHYLEFLSYPGLLPGSEEYCNVELIRGAIRDACGIYRRRVESSLSQAGFLSILVWNK